MVRALLLSVLPLLVACKTPAEKAVESWLDSECDQRAGLVAPVDASATWWRSPQEGGSSCVAKKKPEVDAKACETAKVGSTCEVILKGRDSPFCLNKVGESEFKIDAGCSYGVSDVSAAAIADKGLAGKVVLLRGRLSLLDQEVSGYNSSHYFTARLDDGNARSLTVVASRDTKSGKSLYDMVKDGKPHRVSLLASEVMPGTLSYGEEWPASDVVEVIEGVAGWRAPELERQTRAAAARPLRRCCSSAMHLSHRVLEAYRLSQEHAPAAKKCVALMEDVLAGTTSNEAALKEVRGTYPEEKDWPDDCHPR